MARILVIDDEPNIRAMVALALRQGGHTVEEAEDGIDGLERFGDGSGWDVTLLDQRMPGLAGLDVLRYMKELAPSAAIVMMTAFGTVDLALDVMEAGATDFLRKPFPLEALRGAVTAAMLRPAITAPESAVAPDGGRFHRVTLNGFLIQPLRQPATRRSGELQQTVAVRMPNGNLTPCIVAFPSELVESIRRTLGEAEMHARDRFWQALAEEMMAQYLWDNANVPMGAVLRRADYEPFLDRWLTAVAGRGQGAWEHGIPSMER
ncbi:MAG TPA: response regulator [Armatimonadota bacterium]|jgi:DNA-binding response OmpR family regulator